MAVYSHNGRRGELSLFYEDEDVAIDIAEYPRTSDGVRVDAEMFINYKAIPGLIAALERMQGVIEEKVRTRAEKAAASLSDAGVNPKDPDGVTGVALKNDPATLESVALHYLQEAARLRAPIELPF